jgi:hypothetical protein
MATTESNNQVRRVYAGVETNTTLAKLILAVTNTLNGLIAVLFLMTIVGISSTHTDSGAVSIVLAIGLIALVRHVVCARAESLSQHKSTPQGVP